MTLSIRNQLSATVTDVTVGEAMATVKATLSGGQVITAAVTADAVKELGFATGSPVQALVKSTEVALATEPLKGISIRNQLAGSVSDIATGGAMATIRVSVDGAELTSVVTKDALAELGLTTGSPVVALVKSTEFALATA